MQSIFIAAAVIGATTGTIESEEVIRAKVSRLDMEFQAAVKRNDAEAIDRILHPDFVLILGDGRVEGRAAQIEQARTRQVSYEIQDEVPGTQTVRLFNETAVGGGYLGLYTGAVLPNSCLSPRPMLPT